MSYEIRQEATFILRINYNACLKKLLPHPDRKVQQKRNSDNGGCRSKKLSAQAVMFSDLKGCMFESIGCGEQSGHCF